MRDGLQALKNKGYKLVSLTNSSNQGVYTQFKNADLLSYFDERLSVEDINLYKPDTRTYEWAIEKMGIAAEDAMLVRPTVGILLVLNRQAGKPRSLHAPVRYFTR